MFQRLYYLLTLIGYPVVISGYMPSRGKRGLSIAHPWLGCLSLALGMAVLLPLSLCSGIDCKHPLISEMQFDIAMLRSNSAISKCSKAQCDKQWWRREQTGRVHIFLSSWFEVLLLKKVKVNSFQLCWPWVSLSANLRIEFWRHSSPPLVPPCSAASHRVSFVHLSPFLPMSLPPSALSRAGCRSLDSPRGELSLDLHVALISGLRDKRASNLYFFFPIFPLAQILGPPGFELGATINLSLL